MYEDNIFLVHVGKNIEGVSDLVGIEWGTAASEREISIELFMERYQHFKHGWSWDQWIENAQAEVVEYKRLAYGDAHVCNEGICRICGSTVF